MLSVVIPLAFFATVNDGIYSPFTSILSFEEQTGQKPVSRAPRSRTAPSAPSLCVTATPVLSRLTFGILSNTLDLPCGTAHVHTGIPIASLDTLGRRRSSEPFVVAAHLVAAHLAHSDVMRLVTIAR